MQFLWSKRSLFLGPFWKGVKVRAFRVYSPQKQRRARAAQVPPSKMEQSSAKAAQVTRSTRANSPPPPPKGLCRALRFNEQTNGGIGWSWMPCTDSARPMHIGSVTCRTQPRRHSVPNANGHPSGTIKVASFYPVP